MKNSYYAVIVLLSSLAAGRGIAQDRMQEPGLITFEPPGISAPLWTSTVRAFDFGLGWSARENRTGDYTGVSYGLRRDHFHVDHLWESFEPASPDEGFSFAFESGGGNYGGSDTSSAESTEDIEGAYWLLPRTPVEKLFDFMPLFEIITPSGVPLDPGIGARFVF